MSTTIKLFFVLVLLKGVTWSLLVPLWHFPDEQAHFGHVAYLAEGGTLPHGRKPDLTGEIYISEEILGTKRDYRGNNRFTFHPEYRIEYSQTLTGPQEEKIKNLPLKTRKNFVIRESAYYPHFFYRLSGLIYKLFYYSNLFIRVFAIRLFWLAAYLLMIWFIFKTAQLIFPKNLLATFTITILAGFQPMLSFVAAGVSSDNLHNLLFTAVIYFSLKLMTQIRWPDIVGLSLSLALGLINKPQFFIAFIIVAPLLLINLIKTPKHLFKYLLGMVATTLLAYILSPEYFQLLLAQFRQGQIPYLISRPVTDQAFPHYRLSTHFIWSIKHTIREVLPWYWGVFNWLGVVLPRWVNRVLMRLLAAAAIGLVIKTASIVKQRKLTRPDKLLGFVAWAALAYFLVLFFWDWGHFKNIGFSFGIQGRYYFPVIASHMILLFIGIQSLAQVIGGLLEKLTKKKITPYLLPLTNYLLSIWFVILNFIALYTIAKSYYDVTSFKSFIIQASQYKPFFAKGWWLTSSLVLYLAASLSLLWYLGKLVIKEIKHEK